MQFNPASVPASDRGYDQSAVPLALRQKVAQSDKALDMMREGKNPMDPANWQVEQPPANPPPTPPQAPQQAQEPAPQPTAPKPSAQQQTPPAAQEQPPEGDQTWEQRFKSLEGQFHTQQRVLQGLENENQHLRSTVTQLEQGTARPPATSQDLPAGQNGKVDISQIFSEDEQADWGPEWVKAMQRVADAVAGPMQARIDQLEGTTRTINQREARTARQVMEDGLASAGIDFEDLNVSPDFIEWVNKIDMGAGKLRKDLIQDAWNRNEGSRVEHFARQFLRDVRGAEPEAQPPKSKSEGRATAPRGQKGLEELAAPGKGKGSEPPRPAADPAQPETFTAKQYMDFYRDKSLGRLKMTPEEVSSWQKRLDDAYREGRIIQTPTE